MELTSDLIAVQSILSKLIKDTGEFSRINYRGGNEGVILKIMNKIQLFLKSQNYIKDNKPNDIHHKQLENIVVFLALNTTFKHPLELPDYSHLTNITPPLSKCILANIVYGLDLCKYFHTVFQIFPLNSTVELLDEMLQCLQKSTPKSQLEYATILLMAVADKLSKTNYCPKVEDDIDNICEVSNMILMNLSGIYSDQIDKLNQDQVYNHMGFCLLALFKLLSHCDQNCSSLTKFVSFVIGTCSTIVRNVTINVYCAWAEIDMEDENLQTAVSNSAYSFIETYQKSSDAKELIGMLGFLARKPKSLTEQIYESDIDTMIRKINKSDKDQNSWFRALLRTQFHQHKEAVNCIRLWSHLCNGEDMSLLLNWCLLKNDEETVKIVVKCASNLTLDELIMVSTKHFYKNKFINLASTEVENSLIRLLNKLKDEDLSKDFLLLFLQKPETVLINLFEACLKSTFYSNSLRGVFDSIKEIVKINHIGATVLLKVAENVLPSVRNVDNYIELLKVLKDVKFFNDDEMLSRVLGPMLDKCYGENSLEEVEVVLQMFLGIPLTFPVTDGTKHLTKLFLAIVNENRCKFLDFDGLKQQTARRAVDVCCEVCKPSYSSEMDIFIDDEDDFTRYYRMSLISGRECSLFRTLCTDFDVANYGNSVNSLLKVLPPAVSREWLQIAREIVEMCGNDKCIELLTDIIVLLSQLVETQDTGKNKSILPALKCCVQNYGMVVQQILSNNSTLETEIAIDRQICRLLSKLPNTLKEEEGLSLVNVLTERSLKFLAKDKDFLCQLILVKNSTVCRVLARKMTG